MSIVPDMNAFPSLFIIEGGHVTERRMDGRRMLLGADPSRCALAFPEQAPDLRPVHGEFGTDGGRVYYRQLAEHAGTTLDRRPLTAGAGFYLEDGDILEINGGKAGKNKILIAAGFDIRSRGIWNKVSMAGRLDALTGTELFRRSNRGWCAMPQSGGTQVFLNGEALKEPALIRAGDCIRAGGAYYISDGEALFSRVPDTHADGGHRDYEGGGKRSRPLQIDIKERSVTVLLRKKRLLKDIHIRINPGEMVLILGGSGAGKTTFMNAVMGYEKADGRILYGKTDIYKHFDAMKHEIGFVPQQDLIRASDTVRKTLENAADMKLPKKDAEDPSKRNKRIEYVLKALGLTHEEHSLVSKLSGGQKKRLSIAVEYVSDPGLFFLDEPDSGLDGNMARNLMENLRTIADEGKVVLVISHSPDRAADLFDKVIVLAKSTKENCGRLAFYGPVRDAYRFFGTNTLEAIVKKVNRRDEGGDGLADEFIRAYEASGL